MAQAQLEFTEETLKYFQERGIQSVQWSPYLHQICCHLNEKLRLVVKKNGTFFLCFIKEGDSPDKT